MPKGFCQALPLFRSPDVYGFCGRSLPLPTLDHTNTRQRYRCNGCASASAVALAAKPDLVCGATSSLMRRARLDVASRPLGLPRPVASHCPRCCARGELPGARFGSSSRCGGVASAGPAPPTPLPVDDVPSSSGSTREPLRPVSPASAWPSWLAGRSNACSSVDAL